MRARVMACLVSVLIATSGCSVMRIKQQAEFADHLAVIRGSVELRVAREGVVNVALYRRVEAGLEVVRKSVVAANQTYEFEVAPGTYSLGAFVDTNDDNEYQSDEPAGYVGAPDPSASSIVLEPAADVTAPDLIIEGTIEVRAHIDEHSGLRKFDSNTGRIASLDEPMFSFESAKMGLWRPVDFLDAHGGGLMMLQKYDPHTVPVVFVHGIAGTAASFSSVIEALDKDQFQPWVLQYPSGVRLEVVSEYLRQALDTLHARYKFPRIMIVAHSMGGLMTRSYVMKYLDARSAYEIAAFVTINSPLQGMDSAITGVRHSPIVVPVWRDMASDSDYVQRVNAWQWPKSIPYHLIFSFLPGEEGDGVVPLKSQLTLPLQDQSVAIVGFQSEHTALLADTEFRRRLLQILSAYSEPAASAH